MKIYINKKDLGVYLIYNQILILLFNLVNYINLDYNYDIYKNIFFLNRI